tara:strand:- start:6774 stop:6890 length:117 start_codon:yes stop_codon:yes gene_type:complete
MTPQWNLGTALGLFLVVLLALVGMGWVADKLDDDDKWG